MYYLLKHKSELDWELWETCDKNNGIDKQMITDNTFLLTLDGDVDFQPSAVHRLVDLMKTDKRVGSVCGRIHPLGKGTKAIRLYPPRSDEVTASPTLLHNNFVTA